MMKSSLILDFQLTKQVVLTFYYFPVLSILVFFKYPALKIPNLDKCSLLTAVANFPVIYRFEKSLRSFYSTIRVLIRIETF